MKKCTGKDSNLRSSCERQFYRLPALTNRRPVREFGYSVVKDRTKKERLLWISVIRRKRSLVSISDISVAIRCFGSGNAAPAVLTHIPQTAIGRCFGLKLTICGDTESTFGIAHIHAKRAGWHRRSGYLGMSPISDHRKSLQKIPSPQGKGIDILARVAITCQELFCRRTIFCRGARSVDTRAGRGKSVN